MEQNEGKLHSSKLFLDFFQKREEIVWMGSVGVLSLRPLFEGRG